jgi:hypothetical protein
MTEQDTTNAQLNLNDFIAVVNLVDVCTERGAFKGNELLAVGTIRERFSAFVKANNPTAQESDVGGETEVTEGAQ